MAVDYDFRYALADFISFRDQDACERVRAIKRAEIADHANPEFRIRVVDDPAQLYREFAEDIVARIRAAADEGRLADGDLVLFSGYGAGMTWASALVRWVA